MLYNNIEVFMIEIKNLYLSFTKEFDALHNINLEVKDGEKIVLLGEADSGKTMLLRVLAKLEKFQSGEVYIKDINIDKISFKHDLSVGFVPKSFVFLKNKTVKENFVYILKERKFDSATINLKVLTALKTFGIENIQNLKIKDLSPYQKALAELARISMRKIDLYLIDDICSGLVPSEAQNIINKFLELMKDNQESTFIFAMSNQYLAKQLNCKIINLVHGCIEEIE